MTTILKTELNVGDIIHFHQDSFGWTYPHGPGPGPQNVGLRGLVVKAAETRLEVLLLRWFSGLDEWDNILYYDADPDYNGGGGLDDCAPFDITGNDFRGFRVAADDERLNHLVRGLATLTQLGWDFDKAWSAFDAWFCEPIDNPIELCSAGVVLKAAHGQPGLIKGVMRSIVEDVGTVRQSDFHKIWFACSGCADDHLPTLTTTGDWESECLRCLAEDHPELELWPIHGSTSSKLVWGYLGGSDTDEFHACLRYIFDSVISAAGKQLRLSSHTVADLRARSRDFDLGGWAAVWGDLTTLEQLLSMTCDALEYVKEEMKEMLLEDEERDREVTPEDMIRTEIQNLRKAIEHAEGILHSMEALSGR